MIILLNEKRKYLTFTTRAQSLISVHYSRLNSNFSTEAWKNLGMNNHENSDVTKLVEDADVITNTQNICVQSTDR